MNFYPLPAINPDFIEKQSFFFLFQSSLCDKNNYLSYIFVNPKEIIKVSKFSEVEFAFKKIEEYSKKYYLSGYFSYELGLYFENIFAPSSFDFPLINLAVFDKPIIFNHKEANQAQSKNKIFSKFAGEQNFKVSGLKFIYNQDAYAKKINFIKQRIKIGDTYQVNFTGRMDFDFEGTPYALFQDLLKKQPVSYSAFCKMNEEYILSLSPELFFRRKNNFILSKPMKGTISRGINIAEDREKIKDLRQSKKNLAENLMIVDLVRNDLGRICRTSSVKVSKIFEIEKYKSLFQMTSSVSGALKANTSYEDIFKNTFPGGSVTGAPKISTMKIIRDLEAAPRKVYCGALGFISPNKQAVFNLPIRTVVLNGLKGQMGVGSGIVTDSDPSVEFEECILKSKFLTEKYNSFMLFETLLWEKAKFKFLNEHLKRMRDSALYFDFVFDKKQALKTLSDAANNFVNNLSFRVRLNLAKDGKMGIEYSKFDNDPANKQKYITISSVKTYPENIYLYHKTTNRGLYAQEFNKFRKRGFFDVVFTNTRKEITEGAISNIFIKVRGNYFTPPVSSGLLPGIYRQYLLKKLKAKEKKIFIEDLSNADKIFLSNSVRRLTEVLFKTKGFKDGVS